MTKKQVQDAIDRYDRGDRRGPDPNVLIRQYDAQAMARKGPKIQKPRQKSPAPRSPKSRITQRVDSTGAILAQLHEQKQRELQAVWDDEARALLVLGQAEQNGMTANAARTARIRIRDRKLRLVRDIEHKYQRAEMAAQRGAPRK